MRRVKRLAIILCALFIPLSGFVVPAAPQNVQSVVAAAVRSICIVLADGGGGTSSGSGFVVADGFVLTAHHVVQSADRLRALCPDHPAIEAKLVNADADNDMALLHNPLLSIRPLPLGNSARVQLGQEIVVIGFPRADLSDAETATVTQGIVSAVRGGALQIQAPVGPGNNGSPVLTLQGQVVGVVRAVLGSQVGSNFATSLATGIDAAKPFLTSALGGLYGGVAVGNAPPVRSAPTPAPSSSGFVITPGRGIGDVQLGMTGEQMQTLHGPAKEVRQRPARGGFFINWFEFDRGLWAILSPNGKAIMIGVDNDPRYVLQGLHTGNTETEVRAALGEPSRVELANGNTKPAAFRLLYYDPRGLRFVISNNPDWGNNGLVITIAISRPGCVFVGAPPVLQGGSCD